jgi:hypothetical protein
MMTTNLQAAPYLPRQRNFPIDNVQALGVELDKAYIEIASRVNDRIVGLFSTNLPAITGESWYLQGQPRKQQTLRRVFIFTSLASITHGITTSQYTRMYGQYTDGTKWYGFIAGNIAVPIAGQILFDVTPTVIEFASGSTPPTFVRGNIVLEWLSLVDTNS